MIACIQRRITSPLPKHHIPQRIVRHRRVRPLIHQPRRPRSTCRPRSSGRTCSPNRPLRPRQPRRPLQPCSTRSSHQSQTSLCHQTPLHRTQPRRIPHIPRHQRDIARPLKHHHIVHHIVHGRVIGPPIPQPRPHSPPDQPVPSAPQHPCRPSDLAPPESPCGPVDPGTP